MAIQKKTTVIAKSAAKPAPKLTAKIFQASQKEKAAGDSVQKWSKVALKNSSPYNVIDKTTKKVKTIAPIDSLVKYSEQARKLRNKRLGNK
jgi:hypothetical protein